MVVLKAIRLMVLCLVLVSIHAMALEMVKRPADHRSFEFLVLQNDLKVLLISDPSSPKGAASIDVNAGSGEDPLDRPGLAHFLEHMLFLGSRAYPEASEFSGYITGQGGTHNAFTSLMHTNYFFDVNGAALEGALARFSSMFVSPLLQEQYVEREVNAVHSEFTSKFEDDYRRNRDVMSELVVAKHPLSKFATGNLGSLSLSEPRPLINDLRDFYGRYYVASNMTLVISGPQTVTQLRKWAKQYFTDIPVGKVEHGNEFDRLFPEGVLGQRVNIQPKKEVRKLSLIFPVPTTEPYQKQKPTAYIGHLLGHEASGSLLSALRELGWATGLSAGGKLEWRGGEAFTVDVALTVEGVQHIDEIQALLFATVDQISGKGVNAWRFDEFAKIGNMEFKFGEAIDPIYEVLWLASRLHRTVPERLLVEPYLYEEFDEKLIRQYLSKIARDNLLAVVMAPEVDTRVRSKIYQTPYQLVDNPIAPNNAIADDVKKIRLPGKNAFIPSDFTVVDLSQKHPQALPEKVYENAMVTGWFANDNTFDIPKTSLHVRVNLPKVADDVGGYAAAQVFSDIITQSLNEAAYDASIGGLSYSLGANYRGLSLELTGYSDTLPKLNKIIVKQISKYRNDRSFRRELNQRYFDKVRTEYERRANNQLLQKPYGMLYRELPNVIYDPYWSAEDVAQGFTDLNMNTYEKTFSRLFDGARLEVFVFGNEKKRTAKKIIKQCETLFLSSDIKTAALSGKVLTVDPKHTSLYVVPVQQQDQAVVLYMQGRDDSYSEQVMAKLAQQLIANGFYSELRTEQQLGYVVSFSEYTFKSVPGLAAVVQSPHASAALIYQRMRSFFKSYKTELKTPFDQAKASLATVLQEKKRTQAELAQDYWSQILLGQFQFDHQSAMLEALSNLTYEQFLAFYEQVILSEGYGILLVSKKAEQEAQSLLEMLPIGIKPIQNLKVYKAGKNGYLYP